MFPPDRMIAHDLSPGRPGRSGLGTYMDREWASAPSYLGDRGEGDDPVKVERRSVGFLTRVVRSTKTTVRAVFL
jgi:hypothetical protein